MNKLLFFTKMNFGEEANGGIKNKVMAQKRAFEVLGFDVDFLYVHHKNIVIENKNGEKIFTSTSKFSFLNYLFGGFLQNAPAYQYVYVRHFLTNPLFLRLLAKLKSKNRAVKIYMEIPTFPYQFEFAKFSLVKRLSLKLDLFTALFFKKFIDKIVTFSSKSSIYGIPTLLTDNGIDVEKFGLIDPPAVYNGTELHLLGLANMQVWHGLDRLIEGIKIYNTDPQNKVKILFHLVGKGDELPRLQAMVSDYGLGESVIFHGFLSGKDLENMFATCHIGIGSLGMHRINAAKGETSALKSREFASRGLPFVIAYHDRGFPDKYPYILNLDADETPINIYSIIAFYSKVSQLEKFNFVMNQYAKDNFTWIANLQVVAQNFLQK